MNFGVTVLILATIISVIFGLSMTNDWLSTTIYCEGFGCVGLGLINLGISAFIIIIFIICGLRFGPAPIYISALYTGGAALMAMIISFQILSIHNQSELERNLKDYEEACAEYPQLCPERKKL